MKIDRKLVEKYAYWSVYWPLFTCSKAIKTFSQEVYSFRSNLYALVYVSVPLDFNPIGVESPRIAIFKLTGRDSEPQKLTKSLTIYF
jgi:hypothetical protein